jgi:exosortase
LIEFATKIRCLLKGEATMPNSAGVPPKEDMPKKVESDLHGGTRTSWSAGAIVGACILLAAFFLSDIRAWTWMYDLWMTNPDNSHGLLVPAFSIWLLWQRRDRFSFPGPPVSWTATLMGVTFLALGIFIRCMGIYTRTITFEAASIVPCVAGIVLLCFGWAGARWAWPSVIFLVFMIPIPYSIGGILGSTLQSIATISSTFMLQTIGIPAISEGNIIWLTDKPLGVAQACSGLRMMTSFFALAAGVALVINRPVWEKCLIILSAPMIAIASNVLRISATAVAYEFGNEKMAELIFHDLAGWLMMPVGLAMLWAELFVFSRLFQKEDERDFRFSR